MLTIAVIGAGFSGSLTAVHLLRSHGSSCARVILLESSGRFGPGAAYGTSSSVHYLNVPAGNMSAFDGEPTHFLKWAQARLGPDGHVATGSFLPRGLYGEYLTEIVQQARTAAGERLVLHPSGARSVKRESPGGRLTIIADDGATFTVDRVVIAAGNALPQHPPLAIPTPLFDQSPPPPWYIRNPWRPEALDPIRPDEPVLIVGAGLTMMDVVMQLHAEPRHHEGRIYAISRHGLLPRPHRSPSRPPTHRDAPGALKNWNGSAKSLLRIIREAVRDHAAKGTDWRDVITSLRAITPALWNRLEGRERERFLSRLRSYWDIVRHRAAPETAAVVADLIAARQLVVRAGRLISITPDGSGPLVTVAFRPRGSSNPQTVRVARIINCLGPDTDVRRADHPLIRQMLADGLVSRDAFGLGLEAADSGAAIGSDGRPSDRIFIVGPFRRAQAWENTAVPELRKQAAQVAAAAAEHAVNAHLAR